MWASKHCSRRQGWWRVGCGRLSETQQAKNKGDCLRCIQVLRRGQSTSGMVPAYHSLTPSQVLALCLIRSFHGKRILTMLSRNSIVWCLHYDSYGGTPLRLCVKISQPLCCSLIWTITRWFSWCISCVEKKTAKTAKLMCEICVRFGSGDHISPHRATLGWLRIESRRHYFMGILMYKIMRMHNPDYLESLFFWYVPRFATRGEIKELTAPA